MKVSVAYIDVCVFRYLEEKQVWATDELLQVISNIVLFKSYTTKKLRNKAIFKFK